MARGKHAQRAENRNWKALEDEVSRLREDLIQKKKALQCAQKEVLRLRSIEKLFDESADVIAELERTRKELDDCQGRQLVYVERLNRWAKAMAENELTLPKDIWADLTELGYFESLEGENRWSRRAFQSGGKMRNRLNRAMAQEGMN